VVLAGTFRVRNLRILTPIPIQSVARRYVVAILTGILAILLRWLLDPVLGNVAFYATVYIAVAYCAVVCGSTPAIVSGAIGFLGVFYWFVDPRYSFRLINLPEIHGVIGFLLVSAVLIGFGQANRNKQLRLNNTIDALTTEATERQRAEAALRKAHDELEQRVIERTSELSSALKQLEAEVGVREQAESRLRHLSRRLMTLQDEERRRIARDLHDTVGQTLAAMKMSIALIRQIDHATPGLQPLLDDLDALADEALQEVRTTSYLLHPPLLDEAGIASATRWFVEGFARRSGIQLRCDTPDKMERPSRECELVLFRVLQESLTNVHRHSEATAATIRLARANDVIQLEICDNGKGISEERLRHFETSPNKAGVGITGMRERVRELGGHIEIKSLNPGTSICVTLPTTIETSVPDAGSPVELAS
jgi:signal transduction histidine kinase